MAGDKLETRPQTPARARWQQTLLPEPARHFPYRRSLRLALRTGHILSSGTVLGGVIFGQPWSVLEPWWLAMLTTGLLLFLTDLHASCVILFQVSGLVVVAKLGLAALAGWVPALALPSLLLAMIVGSISSHMPGRLRHHRVLFRHTVGSTTARGSS